MTTLSLVIDIIFILILVSIVLDCRRKGFFKAFFSLVATAISVLIAHEYSPSLAEWANEAFIRKAAVNTFAEAISSYMSNGTQAVLDAIPDYIVEAAESGGVAVSSVISDIGSSFNAAQAAEQIYGGIYAILVAPILVLIAFIVIYAITNSVLSVVIRFINNVFKLPVLKSLNRFFGGVLGAVKGIVILVILGFALVIISPILPEEFGEAVNSSILPNIFYDFTTKI